jgi:hypothetical protein
MKFTLFTESYIVDVDTADSDNTNGVGRIVAWFSSEITI